MQRLLVRYLDEAEIVPVDNIEDAADQLSQIPAQAVVINAPDVGDALSRLDEGLPFPVGIPALVCSLPGIEQASSQLGVWGYLVKPISARDLLAALDGLGDGIRRVLLVDDEPEILQLFSRVISAAHRDYQVIRAMS